MTEFQRMCIAELKRDLPPDHPARRADVIVLWGDDDALAWGILDRTTLPGELRWEEYGIVGHQWTSRKGQFEAALEQAWREETEAA